MGVLEISGWSGIVVRMPDGVRKRRLLNRNHSRFRGVKVPCEARCTALSAKSGCFARDNGWYREAMDKQRFRAGDSPQNRLAFIPALQRDHMIRLDQSGLALLQALRGRAMNESGRIYN